MDCMKDWLYPATRIADAIKFRPASLELFYGLDCNPWAQGEKTLEWLGVRNGLPTEQILWQLEEMPVPAPVTHWEDRPVYSLIDFLTAQHRQFIHSDLPAFRMRLEMPAGRISGTHSYRLMEESFQRFSASLRRHMREEEEYHFPAILKNDYAMRHGRSGRVRPMAEEFLASDRLIEGEDEISIALDRWMRSAEHGLRPGAEPSHPDIAVAALRDLALKIRAHERLEQERLYPMAARIEMELACITVI